MAVGSLQSEVYRQPQEFIFETYCLAKNSQLTSFLAQENAGMWVLKNTSMDKEAGITLIYDVAEYKKSMLHRVRRGPREKLQAIVGTT